MKRILALLLCLAMAFSVTACKPDNIKYPVEIIDPSEQGAETEQETGNQPETKEEPAEETEEKLPEESEPAEDQPETKEETEEKQPEESEKTEEEQPEEPAEEEKEEEEQPKETVPTAPQNPLAIEGFTPSMEIAGTLNPSGMIKPGTTVSALKNRTITIYTADDQTAFEYTDKNNKRINEWEWMDQLAKENGFLLKRHVKSNAVSLKAQRVALFSGQKLSLIQMLASELGNGLTLATSAEQLIEKDVSSFGISKAVLEQSDYKLFAPVGNIESLWYDPSALPEETDLQALNAEKKWTVEAFKTLCEGSQSAQRLNMADPLPWATLSGRSPLTLAKGKLDSNLNAGVTREVWTAIKELDLNTLQLPRTTEEMQEETTLFTYTAAPAPAEGKTVQYLPLPSLKEETAGTVTFTGTFLALPKYEEDQESLRAALTFAELWCNRYTEVRAGFLQTLGIKGEDYQAYCDFAETQGVLILDAPELRETAEPYLAGLTDSTIDMNAAYEKIRNRLNGLIAARNLYY